MNTKQNSLHNDEDLEFLASLRKEFFIDALESLEKAEKIILEFENGKDENLISEYKRILHSIKGSAKAVEENDLAHCIHTIEDKLKEKESKDNFVDYQLGYLDLAKNYLTYSKIPDKKASDHYISLMISYLNIK